MDLSDLDKLLEPLSPDEPCGSDLEYDAEFGEMERSAQGKGEQQFGDTVVAAEPPEWKAVKKHAESLLDRTKDMRVVAYLSRAVLSLEGLYEFHKAIALLRGYLETFWDTLHPELDHDDNDDPTYRTNTLISFCDEGGLLRELRDAPLVASRTVGRFSMRDVERATDPDAHPMPEPTNESGGAWAEDEGGEEAPKSEAPKAPTLAVIEAAFTDVEIHDIQATEEATRSAAEDFTQIEKLVTEKVGVNFAVSLAPVRTLLSEMNQFVVSQLERRGVTTGEPEEEAADSEGSFWDDGGSAAETTSETASTQEAPAAAGYRGGKITSRKDAIKALDDVCDYYEENEPSSPLPLLIRRAQRLAAKSFLDILRDLAPDAVSQAEALGGGSGGVGGGYSGGEVAESSGETDEASSW